MRYSNTKTASFLSRPNRFVAMVVIDGKTEAVHVKNTGRCKELLIPGATVVLTEPGNPARKTRYDLIAVYRDGQLINIDSQAPNKAAAEYIYTLYPDAELIKPEYSHGDSRLDFYIEHGGGKPVFMEVKGVTLLEGTTALFPDAPTERGVKHLKHLAACARAGYEACLLFIVQMKLAKLLMPNDVTHPAFGQALREAAAAGVRICAVDCTVTEDSMTPDAPVPVVLNRK